MRVIEDLVDRLEKYNQAYRRGMPLISDAEYDALVEQLRVLDPGHPFLNVVEPEKFSGRAQVRHATPMLSLEKAYTDVQLERFLARIAKEAEALGIEEVFYRVTPKLDGLAGRDDGQNFATRGNGYVGYEISSAFDKGIVPVGGRGLGLGEIVVVKSYFDERLADKFEHPRNMVVGIVSSDTLNEDARLALIEGKVHFVPYSQLPAREMNARELAADLDVVIGQLHALTDYPMDGVVIEAGNEDLRTALGATNHHYRWQIAVKRKGETAETIVENVRWQVGRTGNITPVLEVSPVNLSGATIRKVTAHHAGMVARLGIGPGARIEIIRSGEVIPKLENVLAPASKTELPEHCPACSHPLEWRGEFLRCSHLTCPAQREQRLLHWFRILGNADWFGTKTIEKLAAAGHDSLEKIYALKEEDFAAMGFGPVQSRNLSDALRLSRTRQVEDWRFLAALGIPDLGVGDSRRLLAHVPLEELATLQPERIAAINGFGDITSRSIVDGIREIRTTLEHLLTLGFELEKTPLLSETVRVESALSGKRVVFTGKMTSGSREDMQARARRLGAIVQSAVGAGTDMLFCGENVGARKVEKALQAGVRILSEEDFIRLAATAESSQ